MVLSPTPFSVGGYNMAKDELDNDFSKKIKAQAKEIAYLKDKITFLENLNKILENRTGQVKKKDKFTAIEQSIKSGRKNVRRVCAIAGVSRCGYYKYLQSNSGKDVEDIKRSTAS